MKLLIRLFNKFYCKILLDFSISSIFLKKIVILLCKIEEYFRSSIVKFVAVLSYKFINWKLFRIIPIASSITPCRRRDPDMESCILRQVEEIRPLLSRGDFGEGYQTPPLEPLHLENIKLGQGPQFQAVFSNMTVHGGSNFIIDRLRYPS